MALIDDVKAAVRISAATTTFDDELGDLIAAAKTDLERLGVDPAKVDAADDPLIKRAIIVFVKASFGWDNPDADRLMRAYDRHVGEVTQSSKYQPEEA